MANRKSKKDATGFYKRFHANLNPAPDLRLSHSKTRVSRAGVPKGFQFNSEIVGLIAKYPRLIEDFLGMRLDCRRSGTSSRNRYLSVSLFDPKDESAQHNFLYKVSLKGRHFFVKEILDPVFPADARTQFALHDQLQVMNQVMKQWNARVLEYQIGWTSRKSSFLVSDWIEGMPLENWFRANAGRRVDDVYQRFLRMERLLKKAGLKDITTRNVIYNSKTDELVAIDLMPVHS